MSSYDETNTENITTDDVQYIDFPIEIDEDIELTLSEVILNLTGVIEDIYCDDIISTAAEFGFTVTDTAKLNDLINIALSAIISENIEESDSLTDIVEKIAILQDILNALDTTSSQRTGTVALAVALTIADLIGEMELVVDNVATSGVFVEVLHISLQILEAIELSKNLSEHITLIGITNEDIEVSEESILQAIYTQLLVDDFNLIINSSLLGGTYSGWIMNPENYAVSNYSNYDFIGNTAFNYKSLYCSSSGLYETGGVLDEASYIESRIKTSTMAFGTSSLKQVPEALLGVNNTGKVVLVISVDGSHTAYYQLNPASQNLETQQIKIGKGLYGRYWQFELVTVDNSTFDLDTFEFFPVSFGRKIGK